MNVLVLLSGVADPKWPLRAVSEAPHAARGLNKMALSPFDEAALETALKIRDGDADTAITVLVVGGPEADALVRKVGAHRLPRTMRLDATNLRCWDASVFAGQLAGVIREIAPGADLVLVGREFGDFDGGTLPPALAAVMGRPFFGLAQHARIDGGAVELSRDRAGVQETVVVAEPLVASVTNDRRNRLRHPLMKNVMEAKRMALNVVTAPEPTIEAARLGPMAEARPPTRDVACRMIEGSAEGQAEELARYLEAWRAEA